MASFSQRHAPPPTALGDEIPSGTRRAIAGWFSDRGIDLSAVTRRWFQKMGYGDATDVLRDVRDRWGDDAEALLLRDIRDDTNVAQWAHEPNIRKAATVVAFLHVPAPLYLDYAELAILTLAEANAIVDPTYFAYEPDPRAEAVKYLNDLFSLRGIHYRFDETGRAEWHGDEDTYRDVVAPALAALHEGDLAGARSEFHDALNKLRAGTPKDLEDAIDEAAKSVESAMKVLLDAHGLPRPPKETAEPLWTALRNGDIVPTPTKDALLAPSRLRNVLSGHGAGAKPRDIPEGTPSLSVQSAAAALSYLASRLP